MDRPPVNGLRKVFAMARPSRPSIEGLLLVMAAAEIGCTGSVRCQARQLSEAVASAAVLAMASGEDDLSAQLRMAEVSLSRPAIWRLATDPDCGVETIACSEAVRQFEAGGFRRIDRDAWPAADRALVAAIAERLFERYRKDMRKFASVGQNGVLPHCVGSKSGK